MTAPASVSVAVGRFEWDVLIRSADLAQTTKIVALTMATYSNRNGTNMHPGVRRLMANCVIRSDKTVRVHLAKLVEAGYLHRTVRGSTSGPRGYADVYQLSRPATVEEVAEEGLAGDGAGTDHRYFDHRPPVNQAPTTGSNGYHPPRSTTKKYVTNRLTRESPADVAASSSWLAHDDLENQLEDELTASRGHGLTTAELTVLWSMQADGKPEPYIHNTVLRRAREVA